MNAIGQAKIIYPLLLSKVKSKETITYGEINSALGYKGNASGHAIRPGMDLIVLYCMDSECPQLTSLIVNKSSGVPMEKAKTFPMNIQGALTITGKRPSITKEFGTGGSR